MDPKLQYVKRLLDSLRIKYTIPDVIAKTIIFTVKGVPICLQAVAKFRRGLTKEDWLYMPMHYKLPVGCNLLIFAGQAALDANYKWEESSGSENEDFHRLFIPKFSLHKKSMGNWVYKTDHFREPNVRRYPIDTEILAHILDGAPEYKVVGLREQLVDDNNLRNKRARICFLTK